MSSVKAPDERLAILLAVFSPWEGIALTYRQFAAELGKPVTEAAVKKWPRRKTFPANVARRIVGRAQERGLVGVTLEWVLWGEGPPPRKATQAPELPGEEARPQGHFATQIGAVLQADLSQNQEGQWASVEVQRTVVWALKDLARRLRVLHFDMDASFDLTDRWAAEIGLPFRAKGARR
jgi:hypothetical protein